MAYELKKCKKKPSKWIERCTVHGRESFPSVRLQDKTHKIKINFDKETLITAKTLFFLFK